MNCLLYDQLWRAICNFFKKLFRFLYKTFRKRNLWNFVSGPSRRQAKTVIAKDKVRKAQYVHLTIKYILKMPHISKIKHKKYHIEEITAQVLLIAQSSDISPFTPILHLQSGFDAKPKVGMWPHQPTLGLFHSNSQVNHSIRPAPCQVYHAIAQQAKTMLLHLQDKLPLTMA